ncbi:suppressor APC domain-containing protein 1 isoform X2 [Phyllopteryx taeniolatus]|uniref:suppressor APC domain-containing protein 1 isoform X2 n=1 Tax=Phyllopteryx taeniolatus TaxID=161469 RepID=UPI002AD25CAD|nr:suppressor APC domain-containing protein 1 isoform X2 [Phyllopteryx taeniolatus]
MMAETCGIFHCLAPGAPCCLCLLLVLLLFFCCCFHPSLSSLSHTLPFLLLCELGACCSRCLSLSLFLHGLSSRRLLLLHRGPHPAQEQPLQPGRPSLLLIKHLKDLEKEKDILCCGLETLEQARLWYCQRLQKSRAQQDDTDTKGWINSSQQVVTKAHSCWLRSRIQRVNASLASVMAEPSGTSTDAVVHSALRWYHTRLTQEVSHKNRQISMLEMEKDALLERLYEVETVSVTEPSSPGYQHLTIYRVEFTCQRTLFWICHAFEAVIRAMVQLHSTRYGGFRAGLRRWEEENILPWLCSMLHTSNKLS